MDLTALLGFSQRVTLRDRLGNHRTARTVCALIEPKRLILCAPESLMRFSSAVTLDCGLVRLHGRLRPLPPGEHEIALSRLTTAFPATARDFTRLGDKVLLVFAPDQTP
ncbi:MAG: hypothetical protein PUG91_04160 [Clostridiales bacterium]|nr:hypothetical protein [Clostridiales bacterium]